MKKLLIVLMILVTLLSACGHSGEADAAPSESFPASLSTAPVTVPTIETTETTEAAVTVESKSAAPSPEPVMPAVILTQEEQSMLLKLGMAERGRSGCTECIALVMCTALNRVTAGRFGSSVRSVILAQDQFTPVADGSYYNAEPNELCYDALEMVLYGWDESQGALYYEWCEGESWHSKNLHLLFQHCNVRFYD